MNKTARKEKELFIFALQLTNSYKIAVVCCDYKLNLCVNS